MGRWPRRISRSKHSSTPLIFSPCRAIKDFTALLLPVGTHEHSQVGQRRSTPFFGCGEAAVVYKYLSPVDTEPQYGFGASWREAERFLIDRGWSDPELKLIRQGKSFQELAET